MEEEVPIGPVQNTKNTLMAKEKAANNATPEGMEFVGWCLDGWLTTYPLLDSKARPVYAFPEDERITNESYRSYTADDMDP